MAGSFISGVKLVVDHGSQTVTVTKPDGAPAWWQTELYISHGSKTVEVKVLGVVASMKCLAGVGNYSEQAGTVGVDFFDDIDASRIGQRIWMDPWLPSTNDYTYFVTLKEYSGDARSLTIGHHNLGPEAAFDNQVSRIEVFLKEGGTEVAPAVNGIYKYEIRFIHNL